MWDFTGAVPKGSLEPGDVSAARELVFRLADPRPFRRGKLIRYGLASLDGRVLAKREKPAEQTVDPPKESAPSLLERRNLSDPEGHPRPPRVGPPGRP